jgi:hypothetical protein
MAKFNVGITYTLWVEVEADSRDDAISQVVTTDYGLKCEAPATIVLNEFDDIIVNSD